MLLGIFLVILGAMFLLKNLGLIALPVSFWSLVWPILILLIGIHIIIGVRRGKRYKEWFTRRWSGRDDLQ